MENHIDQRWQQRFEHFSRAFRLLRSALEDQTVGDYNQLEQEGLIQRFEYTFELAWKTLKDYLEYNGVQLEAANPRNVIKECVNSGMFNSAELNGEVFIEMMLARNALSHTYDFDRFREVIIRVQSEFLPQLEQLYLYLLNKVIDTSTNNVKEH